MVAQGIIEAVRENDMKQPIVARMKGTGAEEAKRLVRARQRKSPRACSINYCSTLTCCALYVLPVFALPTSIWQLQGSGLRIATYDDFKEAAAHAVRAAQSGTV